MITLPAFTHTQRNDTSALTDKILCCKAEDLLSQLPDNCIDMILTSPPYDNLREYRGFAWDFNTIARESYRVLKQGGVCVWVVGDATVNGSETLTSFEQALYFKNVCGFAIETMIYQKNASSPNIHQPRYMQVFEYMFVCVKGAKPKTTNLLTRPTNLAGQSRKPAAKMQRDGVKRVYGSEAANKYADTCLRDNVWVYNTGAASGDDLIAFNHPASFPEQLAHDHIYSWSNPGDIVLDYFMGSGTTAKIARNLGRRFIGSDISAEYVQLAQTRLMNTDPFCATVLPDGSKQLSLFEGIGI